MEGNIGAQAVIFIAYAASIIIAISLGMKIMRKSINSGSSEKDVTGKS